jgi:hypothetical protein
MKRIAGALAAGFLYFCVATVIAATVCVGMLVQKGAFSDGRMLHVWAALHGIEIPNTPDVQAGAKQESQEQPSFEEIVEKRTLVSLDLDLRETAIEKTLNDLRSTETKIRTERSRFDLLVGSFDRKIKDLETNATDAAVLETQQTLEALPPKQAKQQLLMLLEESPSPGIENPIAAVVSLVKAMPIERRRKILAEFKSVDEESKLAEILREILRGAPDVPLLRQARDELQKVNTDRK